MTLKWSAKTIVDVASVGLMTMADCGARRIVRMTDYRKALNTLCGQCINQGVCHGTGCQPVKDLSELIKRMEDAIEIAMDIAKAVAEDKK